MLTVHADRGGPMRGKPVAFLLADMGITKTHSRPYTSTDNPYSEAHFKTLKYRPEFPERFDDIEQARDFCRGFFDWYNHQHRHSGIGLMTPAAVHYGQAQGAPRRPRPSPPGRLRGDARAVRPPGARAAGAADRRVDQQARHEGGRSLNTTTKRLTELDRLRPSMRPDPRVVGRPSACALLLFA